jgi:hypothetical protein
MKDKVSSKSGTFKSLLTFEVGNDGEVDFLEDVLVLALLTESVFAPSGHEASLAGEVESLLWSAYWGDVWTVRIKRESWY